MSASKRFHRVVPTCACLSILILASLIGTHGVEGFFNNKPGLRATRNNVVGVTTTPASVPQTTPVPATKPTAPSTADTALATTPVRKSGLRGLATGCDACPFGEYMVAPCAGGVDTTPTCAACSTSCPEGTELVEPCGVDNDRVCVPTAHAECARKAVTLTVSSLESIMEDNCENCAQYVPHINTALKEGYMACPLRLSAFIAQARHATDGLKFLKSASSNGAGAIHLQPSNFRLACQQVPELKTAFTNEFGGCDISSSEHAAAANIVARPEYAFRVAVWWFATGSAQLLGDPCGDLRFDSDYGLGGAPHFTTRQSPGVGYQKVTTCIASFGVDPGRQQRADYYVAARAYFPDEDPDHSEILGTASRASASHVATVLAVCALVATWLVQGA